MSMSEPAFALTPWGDPGKPWQAPKAGATVDRILDAARSNFEDRGIAATTMEQIAGGAGISRVWLYSHFKNRDAIVRELVRREAVQFVSGVAEHLTLEATPAVMVAEAFAYSVGFLRKHTLLNKLLATEPSVLLPFLSVDAGPLLAMAVRSIAPVIRQRTGFSERKSLMLSEWLVRIAASVVLTRHVVFDFDDPETATQFALTAMEPVLCPAASRRSRK